MTSERIHGRPIEKTYDDLWAETEVLKDLICTLWLYIGRHTETKLTTEQKDLLADMIEAMPDDPDFKYDRWWRDA